MAQFADIEWDLPNLYTLELLGQQVGHEVFMDDELEDLRSVAGRITHFRTSKQLKTLVADQEITSYFRSLKFLP